MKDDATTDRLVGMAYGKDRQVRNRDLQHFSMAADPVNRLFTIGNLSSHQFETARLAGSRC